MDDRGAQPGAEEYPRPLVSPRIGGRERIEEYVELVNVPLIGRLQLAERRLLQEEIRGHLIARAGDLQAQGWAPDRAAAAAVRRFGNPRGVARRLLIAHGCESPQWHAVLFTVLVFGLVVAVTEGWRLAWVTSHVFVWPSGHRTVRQAPWTMDGSTIAWASAALGCLGGWLFRGRHVEGTLDGLGIVAAAMWLTAGAIGRWDRRFDETAYTLIFSGVPWALIGSAAGGAVRSASRQRSNSLKRRIAR